MDEIDMLTKLEELVLDENKIVTFKAFSRCCEVTVDHAKDVMMKFIINKGNTISASYVLTGYKINENQKIFATNLSKDDELTSKKGLFSELLSCDIYSLSNTPPKCFDDIYSSNVTMCKEYNCSSISAPIVDSKITTRKRITPVVTETLVKNVVDNKDNFAKSFQTKPKPSESSGIAAAFAKAPIKKASTDVESKLEVLKNENEDKPKIKAQTATKPKPKPKTTGSMMAFMQKGVNNTISKIEPKKELKPKLQEATDVKKFEKDIWSQSSSDDNEDDKEDPIPPKNKKAKETRTNEKTESKKPAKKMRRIIVASSSEDDEDIKEDIPVKEKVNSEVKKKQTKTPVAKTKNEDKKKNNKQGNSNSRKRKVETQSSEDESVSEDKISSNEDIENDDDIIPPTPVPIKEFKTITKTFQDDEGFFVTRKEKCLVEVQRDDKEAEIPLPNLVKKVVPPQKSKKKNIQSKQKQSTLSNFFSRK